MRREPWRRAGRQRSWTRRGKENAGRPQARRGALTLARLGEGAGKTHGRFGERLGKNSGRTPGPPPSPEHWRFRLAPVPEILPFPLRHAPRAAPAFRHATECVKLSGSCTSGRPLSVRGVGVEMLHRPCTSGRPSGDLAALFEKYSGPWPAGPRALPHRSCRSRSAPPRTALAQCPPVIPFPPRARRAPSPPGTPHRQPPCALPKPPPIAPTFAARRLFFPLIKQAVTPHRALGPFLSRPGPSTPRLRTAHIIFGLRRPT